MTLRKWTRRKWSEGKRLRFARMHLRDCPARGRWEYCAACLLAVKVFEELNLKPPRQQPPPGGEWVW